MTENHYLVFVMPAVWLVGLKVFYDRSWATGRIVALTACFAACFLLYNPLQTTPLGFLSLVILLALFIIASNSPEKMDRTPVLVKWFRMSAGSRLPPQILRPPADERLVVRAGASSISPRHPRRADRSRIAGNT